MNQKGCKRESTVIDLHQDIILAVCEDQWWCQCRSYIIKAYTQSYQVRQTFGHSAVNENSSSQMFRKTDQFICDHTALAVHRSWMMRPCTKDSSQMYCQIDTRFEISDETVNLPICSLEKTIKLSKWVLYSLSDVKKQQPVSATYS